MIDDTNRRNAKQFELAMAIDAYLNATAESARMTDGKSAALALYARINAPFAVAPLLQREARLAERVLSSRM